jgi:hypothetical protein
MSDFEHDDELRAALRRTHPTRNEASSILAANRTRMARARTRRRAAIGSITAASFIAVGGALFAANSTSDTNVIDVVAPPGTVTTLSSTAPGQQAGSTTTAPSATPSTTSSVSTTRSGADQSTTAPPPPVTQPTTATAPTTTAPTTTANAPHTYSGNGGTLTVIQTATAMTIGPITDVAGWTHTVNKNDSDDIEVEWRRGNPEGQAKIRLRLVDGAIREEIE